MHNKKHEKRTDFFHVKVAAYYLSELTFLLRFSGQRRGAYYVQMCIIYGQILYVTKDYHQQASRP